MSAVPFQVASVLQAQLPQSTVNFYDKSFKANLKHNTPFVACSERLDLPVRSGSNYYMYMYVPFTANVSQAAEGAPGAGKTVSVLSANAAIGEYADFATFSSLATVTAIDPMVENIRREMAYQVGQSLSALVRATVDGGFSVDGSVWVKLGATNGTTFVTLKRSDIVNAIQSLGGRGVQEFANGKMEGVIHPFALGDVLADASDGGVVDIAKRQADAYAKLDDMLSVDQEKIVELPGTGVRFHQSALVTKTSNYNGGTGAVSGLTALRTYIFGRGGVYSIKLDGQGDTSFGNGAYQNIECNIMQGAPLSVADPEGLISAWTSYKLHFTTSLGPDTTLRYRFIDAASAIS